MTGGSSSENSIMAFIQITSKLLTLTNLFKPSAVIKAPLVANTYDLATWL